MKKFGMSVLTTALALTLAGGASALAATQESEPALDPALDPAAEATAEEVDLSEGRYQAYSHTIIVEDGKDLTVIDVYFDDILYVEVAPTATVTFVNCAFEHGIDYMGSPGSRLFITEGSQFGPDTCVWLMYNDEFVVLEDTFPRIISIGVPFEVAGEPTCVINFMAMMQDSLVFNGETYTIEGCETAIDPETDEFLEIDPEAEYNCIFLAHWFEDGEEAFLPFTTTI